jgi:hypothetical protein
MSPKTKKMLLIGGAAVAGYFIYTKMKHSTTAMTPAQKLAARAAMQMTTGPTKAAGIEEELGVVEELGSLGGGF